MWKNSTSPSVSEIFLLTQVLQQLSISHSVLSFSVAIYKQYLWRFSWESKWQQQIFPGDFMKSLGLSLFTALPERREKKRGRSFFLLKVNQLLCQFHRSVQKGNMLMTPSYCFIQNTEWKQSFVTRRSDSGRGLIA